MRILGVHHGHDAGVALVDDGDVVAAANEERFSRKKLHRGVPERSLRWVLREHGEDIDAIAVAGLYRRKKLADALRELADRLEAPLIHVEHHEAHAASAYYTSGFDRCLTVTVDAAGDGLSATVWVCEKGDMRRVATVSYRDSLGDFYANVTQMLGYQPMKDEGKTMCLAAYGRPDDDAMEWLENEYIRVEKGTVVNESGLISGEAVRFLRSSPLAELPREDLAATAQRHLERCLLDLFAHHIEAWNEKNVAYAGGVAANVVANMKLRERLNIDLFVHPNMGDGGLALGAALRVWALHELAEGRTPSPPRMEHVYLGPSYDEDEVERILDDEGVEYEHVGDDPETVVEELLEGNVVAVFKGAMEYGPRALGHRSILADPRDEGIVDRLNEMLGRDPFQPFAPTVLMEDFPRYAENACESRFMTMAFRATEHFEEEAPAVVHVDGTTRPQTLVDEDPFYRRIVERFRDETGLGAVLNTSFNVHGEPIVMSPEDALRSFRKGVADVLWVEGFIVRGPSSSTT